MTELRSYQLDAIKAIEDCDDDCVVKMFCGSGKSRVMLSYALKHNEFKFQVFVFPSLSLINQFRTDYLENPIWKIKNSIKYVCSDYMSTTDESDIREFVISNDNKIVCVTYQSFEKFIGILDEEPDLILFDEAHHVIEDYVSHTIFGLESRKIYFTATPRSNSSYSMEEDGDCGPTVYSYTHRDGVIDGILNDFSIHIDFSCENTNESIYDSIARTVVKTGNNRILTFHKTVDTDNDTCVRNFVDVEKFKASFTKFPHKFKSIEISQIDASSKDRSQILKKLENAPDDQVVAISSCRTIGEGVDTKEANMCGFIDPKNSIIEIIQNIGRIVRKQDKPSVILIPCYVDKSKYDECTSSEECDKVIREDINKNGNFNGILNVISALRQSDPELYDLCLRYPDVFTSDEMKKNFEKQGVKKTDLSPITQKRFEKIVQKMPDCRIEVHTHQVDNPVEVFNPEGTQNLVLYRDEDNMYHQLETKKKIVPPRKRLFEIHTSDDIRVDWKITEQSIGTACIDCMVTIKINPMERAQELVQWVREHDDKLPRQHCKDNNEQKLASRLSTWKQALKGKGHANLPDFVKEYLDTEIPGWDSEKNIETYQLKQAKEIVQWFKMNKKIPQCDKDDKYQNYLYSILCKYRRLPEKYQIAKQYLDSEIPDWNVVFSLEDKAMEIAKEIVQFYIKHNRLPCSSKSCLLENKLAIKLQIWKLCIKDDNSVSSILYPSVKQYLDTEIPGWNDSIEDKAMKIAKEIVQFNKDNDRLPSQTSKKGQEYEKKLADKLNNWRTATRGLETNVKLPDTVKQYLDTELPGWNDKINLIDKHMEKAMEIVQFYKVNNRLPKHNKTEKPLANLLSALKKIINTEKYLPIKQYLDTEIPGWNDSLEDNAMKNAKEIVQFYKDNNKYPSSKSKLGQKLGDLRKSLKGKGTTKLYPEVKEYLDTELPGWEIGKTEPEHQHKYTVVDEDEEYCYEECETCGRKHKRHRVISKDIGYKPSNPEKKLEINTWFSEQTFIPGIAIVLDAHDMKTCYLLPFEPSSIIVPEYDYETFETNSKDSKFGKCLRNGNFLEVLKSIEPSKLSLIYADFTGHFSKWTQPLLDYLSSVSNELRPGLLLGITWSENGDKREHGYHLKIIGKFEEKNKWTSIDESPADLHYGKGSNMCVDFFRKL
jgi:superfamily II DNA or RNA helicase